MEAKRPVVLSLAGLDPSAGAGLLADIKTFEQHKVYGLGICTAQTIQTAERFFSIRWEKTSNILDAAELMLKHYEVEAIKIGIVENMEVLDKIISFIHKKNGAIKVVLDPVIRSTSGFDFWKGAIDKSKLQNVLAKVFLITPNYNEIKQLSAVADAKEAAKELSAFCNVLLKGGHNNQEPGTDYLFMQNEIERLKPSVKKVFAKHGSGCVLSSAIAAHLALNADVRTACKNAKIYIEQFLNSNETLSGYHVV